MLSCCKWSIVRRNCSWGVGRGVVIECRSPCCALVTPMTVWVVSIEEANSLLEMRMCCLHLCGDLSD